MSFKFSPIVRAGALLVILAGFVPSACRPDPVYAANPESPATEESGACGSPSGPVEEGYYTGLMGLCINVSNGINPSPERLEELGVDWVRTLAYTWDPDFAALSAEVKASEAVKWLVVLNSESLSRPVDFSDWSAYVAAYSAFAADYVEQHPWIDAVELWNESDLFGNTAADQAVNIYPDGLPYAHSLKDGTLYQVTREEIHPDNLGRFLFPSEFASLLQSAYQAIKAVRPDLPVVAGGLGSNNQAAYLGAVHSYWAAGACYYDGVGLLPYRAGVKVDDGVLPASSFGKLSEKIDSFYTSGLLEECTGPRLWLTEFGCGWSNFAAGDTGEEGMRKQAEYLAACYNFLAVNRNRVHSAFYFAWQDSIGHEKEPGWGLVNPDQSPRCAWEAYRQLTAGSAGDRPNPRAPGV